MKNNFFDIVFLASFVVFFAIICFIYIAIPLSVLLVSLHYIGFI
jgi:hypothetical protein